MGVSFGLSKIMASCVDLLINVFAYFSFDAAK